MAGSGYVETGSGNPLIQWHCAAAELWGNDLYTLLDEVYRKRARFAVVFVSCHYASKPWTQHERLSAQARALTDPGPYLLPVRLDDTDLPGLRPTVAYVDARTMSVDRLINHIQQKLSAMPGATRVQPPILRSPRTIEQTRELLAQRPDGWEPMLYAGLMWQGREALEPRWLDHELGYSRRIGHHLDDSEVWAVLSTTMSDFSACMSNVVRMANPPATERAFGLLGHPGDPALIEHIAKRFIEVYEEILDIAAKLRGTGASKSIEPLIDAAAHVVDAPLQQIRNFIEALIAQTDDIPERLARNEQVSIEMRLTLDIDDEAVQRVHREMERVQKTLMG